MSLEKFVNVNAIYTRSINIERDADSVAVARSYIPTSRALQVLSRVADTMDERAVPRAWSLVGPYGSGKSSFGVFLPHLLGNPGSEPSKAAFQILRKADIKLAESIESHNQGSVGYLPILITGSPESFTRRLVLALHESAKSFLSGKPGRMPKVVGQLKVAAGKNLAITEILEMIGKLQAVLIKKDCRGVIFVIDELGKFLEYEARHYGANDIYLLQALAEKAFEGGKSNLYIFVMMHQAFEQYAKGLGQGLRDEWAKIQGRYESVPFLEAAEQTLRVVGAAIHTKFDAKQKIIVKEVGSSLLSELEKLDQGSSGFNLDEAREIFNSCYPLHPVTAQILPILCQKVAQNERTLFSYLGSHEPHGFQESLTRLESAGDWIYPWEIFDYFILNQPATVTDALTHRRWAEVLNALDRHSEATETEIQLIKTIGLLNIIGQRSGLKASPDLLALCIPKAKEVEHGLESLRFQSIIQFRKFSGEYRVWQGSDFDIDEAVSEELLQLGHFDLVEVLNKRRPITPIVARRATIKGHTLRYFMPIFTDAENFKRERRLANTPRLIIFLSQKREDKELFENDVAPYFSDQDVLGFLPSGFQLRESVGEALAIERIQSNRSELNSDPIAARECKDRLKAAKQAEAEILESILEEPESSLWIWNNKKLEVRSLRAFQSELSKVMETIYKDSPIIRNELINRDKPSAQANSARNKLMKALLNHEDQKEFGIEKFPPEKALYLAVLKEPGFHTLAEEGWKISSPTNRRDANNNIFPLWAALEDFLESTELEAKPFTDLTDKLTAPPFGIKRGLLPIFYAVSYIIHQDETALFEDGIYIPSFTEDMLERFLVRPESFKVQRFRIEGVRSAVFKEYAKALYGDSGKAKSLLSIAKPLAVFVHGLDYYTKHTKSLSETALGARDAILFSKSPQKLIFEELPAIYDADVAKNGKRRAALSDGFAKWLMSALGDLKHCHADLVRNQKWLLRTALSIEQSLSSKEFRKVVIQRYRGIEQYSIDKDGLAAFILRLTKEEENDELWLEQLLMFLGGRVPSKKWTDQTVAKAEIRLAGFARRIRELEKLRLHSKDQGYGENDDLNVFLLRGIRKGAFDEEAVAHVTSDQLTKAAPILKALKRDIGEVSDGNLRFALIGALFEFVVNELNEGEDIDSQERQKEVNHG